MNLPIRLVALVGGILLSSVATQAADVTFNSTPSGATIQIVNVDNTRMKGRRFDNVTPAEIGLRSQRELYYLRFSKPGYESVTISVAHNMPRPRVVNVTLPPLSATEPISFETTPAGATLKIDGKTVGTTPLTTEVTFNRRDSRSDWIAVPVSFSLADYEDVSGSVVERHWNSTVRVELPQLVVNRNVRFDSSPAGAEVKIGGRSVGRTPLTSSVRFSRRDSKSRWSTEPYLIELPDYQSESGTLTHDGSTTFSQQLGRIHHDKTRLLTITDDLGDPIPSAPVVLNGEQVGLTDRQGQFNLALAFNRSTPDQRWSTFEITSMVENAYLPGYLKTAYSEDADLTLSLNPVIELPVTTYFPITEMTARGPRRTVSMETRIGIFDDRDLNSPATELRPVTNFERQQRNLQAVNSFTITPDGQSLIYALTQEADPGVYYSNLFLKSATLGTSPVTQLTRGIRVIDTDPRAGVEENSSVIVFQSNRGVPQSWDISSFRLREGRVVGGIVQLTRDTRFNYGPSFASEQQPIYFSCMDEYPQAEPRISSVRIDGASFTNLGETGESLHLTVQDQIYFTRTDPDFGKQQIFRITTDGFSFAQVINDPQFGQANCFDPAISPDGTKMLFTSDYHMDEQGRRNNNIYLYDLSSGLTPLQLTDNGSDDIMPVWSPTEPDVLYFLSNRRGVYNIWRMRIRVAQ